MSEFQVSSGTFTEVSVDACTFSAPLAFGASDNQKNAVPVKIKARDGDALNHWYWGRCVHDMEGMERHKDHLTIDYCHDPNEVLGFMDSFDISSGDLLTSGQLILHSPDDRASEVFAKSKAGVQYEASICFDGPIRIEKIASGDEVEVNGRLFVGPLTIFRKWSLRGVAICPYGYDRHTETKFKNFAQGDRFVAVETTTNQKAPETSDTKAELKQFINAFGKEKGTDWYLEGKSFDAAKEEFAVEIVTQRDGLQKQLTELTANRDELKKQLGKLTAEHGELSTKFKELETQNTELTTKLGAFDRGEETPMEGEPEGLKQTKKTSFSGSPALDAFAEKHSVSK